DTLQVVYSLINQRAAGRVIPAANRAGMGIIARMVLHFGLLTGKFTPDSRFSNDDHRSMRLDPEQLHQLLNRMTELEFLRDQYGGSWGDLALRFALQCPGISTAIIGVRNPNQASQNAAGAMASPIPEPIWQELAHQAQIRFDPLIDHFK
ncbi:MAG: aldo/keto reductase, partial [Candidatus Delongbacteria bacterium]|nr:aldo/keto reductase [Candidatus Delongbacteria bacterium]